MIRKDQVPSCSCLQSLIFIIVLVGVPFDLLHIFHVLDPSHVKANTAAPPFLFFFVFPALIFAFIVQSFHDC